MVYSYINPSTVYEDYEEDITSEQIKELIESLSFANISEDNYIIEEYITESANSKQLSKAKKLSKETGEKIGNTIKEKGLTKESKKSIAKIYDDFIVSLKNNINEIIVPDNLVKKVDSGEYTAENIKRAIGLTLACICFNEIMIWALSIIIPIGGGLIARGIVCPFVEETAKAIALKGKYSKEFTVIFNISEFSLYVIRGVNPLLRLIPVGMHITTTLVQYFTSDEKIQKKLGLDKEEDKEKLTFIGRIVAYLIHSAYNTILAISSIIQVVVVISKMIK